MDPSETNIHYRTITDDEFLLSDINSGEVVFSFPLPLAALEARGRDVPSYTVTRVARGATYEIHVTNSGAAGERGRLVVDGAPITGNVVPYAAAGSTVRVDVTL